MGRELEELLSVGEERERDYEVTLIVIGALGKNIKKISLNNGLSQWMHKKRKQRKHQL